MKILFIAQSETSDNKREWSGTMHQSFICLQQAGFNVDYLCAMKKGKSSFFVKLLCEWWLQISKRFKVKTRMTETIYCKYNYAQVLQDFDYSAYDVIFIPTHWAMVAALPTKTKAKVVHLVDATFDSLLDYYEEFSGLIWQNKIEGSYISKQAFKRSDLIIASSDWCKKNAIESYQIDSNKIAVVEFGANLKHEDIPAVPKKIDGKSHLNIYISGVIWERKGGEQAVECCEELIQMGYDVTLHITGMIPPIQHSNKSFIKTYGFLNKNNQNEYLQIINLMKQMDIFLFPSKAECSSIALCEACGFGLPIFCYDTGGTSNYVINGKNGYMLPLSSGGKEFAHSINNCYKSALFNRLSIGSIEMYKTKLNWQKWTERVKEAIMNLF